MGVNAPVIHRAAPADAPALLPLMRALFAHGFPEAPAPDKATTRTYLDLLNSAQAAHRLAVWFGRDATTLGLVAVGLIPSYSDPRPRNWRRMALKALFPTADVPRSRLGAARMAWVARQAVAIGACRIDRQAKAPDNRMRPNQWAQGRE